MKQSMKAVRDKKIIVSLAGVFIVILCAVCLASTPRVVFGNIKNSAKIETNADNSAPYTAIDQGVVSKKVVNIVLVTDYTDPVKVQGVIDKLTNLDKALKAKNIELRVNGVLVKDLDLTKIGGENSIYPMKTQILK